jgi:hypothetical protein
MTLFSPIIKAYKTSKYEYEVKASRKSVKLKLKVEDLTETQGVFHKHNLRGNLTSNNSFTLVRRWGLLNINFIDRNPVTLDGRFYYVKDGVTRIKLEVRPNFIFIIFSVIFSVLGMVFFLKGLANGTEEIAAGAFILVFPILCTIAHFSKKIHQERFEKALDLSKEDLIKLN